MRNTPDLCRITEQFVETGRAPSENYAESARPTHKTHRKSCRLTKQYEPNKTWHYYEKTHLPFLPKCSSLTVLFLIKTQAPIQKPCKAHGCPIVLRGCYGACNVLGDWPHAAIYRQQVVADGDKGFDKFTSRQLMPEYGTKADLSAFVPAKPVVTLRNPMRRWLKLYLCSGK